MSVEATATIMRSYLDGLLARGEFADYFTDDVTWTIVGTDQQVQGRKPVRDFLTWMHTQAFHGPPQGQDPGRGRWAGGAGGRLCRHPHRGVPWHAGHREIGPGPYCLVYDLRDGKIAGLRAYIPMELFAQQLG